MLYKKERKTKKKNLKQIFLNFGWFLIYKYIKSVHNAAHNDWLIGIRNICQTGMFTESFKSDSSYLTKIISKNRWELPENVFLVFLNQGHSFQSQAVNWFPKLPEMVV